MRRAPPGAQSARDGIGMNGERQAALRGEWRSHFFIVAALAAGGQAPWRGGRRVVRRLPPGAGVVFFSPFSRIFTVDRKNGEKTTVQAADLAAYCGLGISRLCASQYRP